MMQITINLQTKKCIFIAMLVLLFIYTAGTNYSYGEIIPQDRRTTWNPGIPGGIPVRAVGANAVTDHGAAGDGVADDTAEIQACLNAVSGTDTACYLPAGTYRIVSTLSIASNTVLRGAGPSNTIITVDNTAESVVISMGSGDYDVTPFVNVTAGYAKGSTSLTVADASSFSVGDYIIVTQRDFDDSEIENPLIAGSPTGFPNKKRRTPDGLRSIGQIVEITGITMQPGDDIVDISPQLHWNFEAKYTPQIEKVSSNMAEYSGIEDLYLTRSTAFGGAGKMISMMNSAYSWVKNVESYKVAGQHILLRRCFRCVIRDSYVHHAWTYTSGGGAYGISITYYTSDSLIENNIMYYLNIPSDFENSGGGNVIAYNYSDSAWLNEGYPSRQLGDFMCHGSFPHMELYEGNYVTKVSPDQIHGGSGYLTFFRNHIDAESTFDKDPSFPGLPQIYNLGAVDIRAGNYYINVVGNVLLKPGDTGEYEFYGTGSNTTLRAYHFWSDDALRDSTLYRHGNYDYISDSIVWDAGNADHDLPDSLYLTSKPAFFGALPWPPIGPDRSPLVGILPAKIRFDSIDNGGELKTPNPPDNFRKL